MSADDRSAFESHVAESAPWFRPDAVVMDRMAEVWSDMQAVRATLDEVAPQVERLIEMSSAGMKAVDEITASIPDEVWNATEEIVDDWVVVNQLCGGEAANEAMDLGERLAHIDPPVTPRPQLAPVERPARPPAPTAKALPPEAISYLAAHGRPVAWPAGAVNSRRDHEAPPQSTHFVHWAQQGRQDIAEHGVDWAAGHAEGLRLVTAAEGGWNGQLTSLAAAHGGRPDPLRASTDAWELDSNAHAEAVIAARQAFPTAAEAVDRPVLDMPTPSAKPAAAPVKTLGRSA